MRKNVSLFKRIFITHFTRKKCSTYSAFQTETILSPTYTKNFTNVIFKFKTKKIQIFKRRIWDQTFQFIFK